jgi:hypothetical protein
MRYVRILSKRLETHTADDGTVYYYDPESGTSTYYFPTVQYYWNTLRKLGVVTLNGTVTGAGIELAGKSRRSALADDSGQEGRQAAYQLTDGSAYDEGVLASQQMLDQESADPDHWEFVDGSPPYYYNVHTGESTYAKPKFRKDPVFWRNVGAITRRHAEKYKDSAVFSVADLNAAGGSLLSNYSGSWDGEAGYGTDSGAYGDWEPAYTEDGQQYWFVSSFEQGLSFLVETVLLCFQV